MTNPAIMKAIVEKYDGGTRMSKEDRFESLNYSKEDASLIARMYTTIGTTVDDDSLVSRISEADRAIYGALQWAGVLLRTAEKFGDVGIINDAGDILKDIQGAFHTIDKVGAKVDALRTNSSLKDFVNSIEDESGHDISYFVYE